MPSTTDTLMDGAKCIEYCIPGADMKLAVLISLFAQIAGVSANTDSLISGARCIADCIPGADMKLAVLISLLQQIVPGGGAGATGGIVCGLGEPTSTPATGCGAYIQTDSGPAGQLWLYYSGSWH